MSKRKIITVRYDQESGLWKGQVVGNMKASLTNENKDKVVQKMVEKAKSEGNSQLRIYKKDKPGYEERTYGNDPFPPKG